MNPRFQFGIFPIIALLLGTLIFFSKSNKTTVDDVYQDFDTIEFPYVANSERRTKILNNANNLALGMNKEQVVLQLGSPDFINATFNQIKNGKIIGHGYFYIISQDKREGSVKEKNAKMLVIQFDDQLNLISAWAKGLPNIIDIPRK